MKLRIGIAALSASVLTAWSSPSVAQTAPAAPGPGRPSTAPTAQSTAGSPAGRAVEPPKLLKFFQAPYPETEREHGGKVSVALTLAIDADGKVADVTVVQSAGQAFDDAAVAAARQFGFSPAKFDGVPAAVKIQYRYDFELTAPVLAKKTTADFTGVVRERGTAKPIDGVTVTLDDQQTTTDATGRFSFSDVPPGVHSVSLAGARFTPVGTEETLVAAHKYDATYDVEVANEALPPEERDDFEIVVLDTVLEKAIASTTVSAEQGARVAGTGGDAIKVVENLPGVARSSVGSGALVVWGAGAADTRVYIDDVRVPQLYHEGGFRSVIHSDLVQKVELEPGGYGAAHGRGLGGLVTVGLKPLEADGYHGSLSVDAIDAAASVRGSIGDKFRFAGAVRRSHLDWVLNRFTSEDVGAFVPIPRYYDGQLRLAYVPSGTESVEVGGLMSSDEISRSLVEADPSDTKTEAKNTGFQRVYVRYQKQLGDGGSVIATPYFGFDHTDVSNRFGGIPALLDTDSTVFGVRTAWTGALSEFLSVRAGIDAEAVVSSLRRSGSVTSPPREGDIRIFGQVPSDQVNADDWKTTLVSLAPFAEGDVSLAGGKVHLIPGVRFEPTVITASRKTPQTADLPPIGTVQENTYVEPRLAARWQATERIGLRAAYGVYHQPPLGEDLSPVFGNPNLGPGKAVHYLAGANFKLSKPISIEMTGFYASQTDLVTRSALPTPLSAQALIQGGLGRAYGTQFLLRHDLNGRFFGWISYSILRSERTDAGSTEYRLFDFDQTHVFTALASYDLGLGFEIGARFRYSTGYPRTPVVGVTYDSRSDSFAPVFGAHNSIRIPSFYQFDARVAKRFHFSKTSELELYLDVQNVTDHRNPEELVYNYDYSRKSYITGLPVLPVAGGKLTW